MKKIIFIIILALFFGNTFAQTSTIDSLNVILQNAENDTVRINTLYEIGIEYENSEPSTAIKYYRQGLQLSIKIKNSSLEAQGLRNIAIVHDLTEKYTLALELYEKSLVLYENSRDTVHIANLFMNIGGIYYNRGMLDSAIFFTLKGINLFETLKDTAGIKFSMLTLSAISTDMENYSVALDYLAKSLELVNSEYDSTYVCLIYNNMGIIYQKKGQFQFAYKHFKKALVLAIKYDLNTYLPSIYINLASTLYLDKRYDEAIVYYYKTKRACEDINDPIMLVDVYVGISKAYLEKKMKKTALGFLILANNIIDMNSQNVPLSSQIDVFKLLADIYHDLGKDDIAYKYLNKKEILHDSLVKIVNYKISSELEIKYNMQYKQNEINNLQTQNSETITQLEISDAEKKSQARVLFLLVFILLLIIISSIWIVSNYLKNKKLSEILELKNNELTQAQVRVEQVINSLPQVFFETDIHGKITHTNSNFFDISGYTPYDVILGLNYVDLIKADDLSKLEELKIDENDIEKIISFEFEFVRKDKSTFPAILSLNIVNDESLQGYLGVIIDITEKRKTEQELMLLKTSVQQTNSSLVITDNQGKIVYVNPAFEKNTGYSLNEVLNLTPRILKSEKTSTKIYKNLWDTILQGKVWKGTFLNKKKNGELFWERNIISPLKDKNGNITHFVANKENIDDEVKQNEKINKLFTAAENSPTSVAILDIETKLTYVNPAFEHITGYKQEEVLGKDISILDSGTHKKEFYSKIRDVIYSGNIWQGILINKKKNGELFWDSSVIIPLKNEFNEIIGFVCNDVDITKQIKTQEKLQNTLKALNDRNEEIFSSIKYAKRIQRALIPEDDEFTEFFGHSFVLFLPKDYVSGDFYWIYETNNYKFTAVVDCTGHGVPGALLSIIGYNLLESAVKEHKLEIPAEILDYVNDKLRILFSKTQRKNNIQDGMEMAIVAVNYTLNKIQFASSRNRLYLVRHLDNHNEYEEFFELVTANSTKQLFKINGNRQYLAKENRNFNFNNFEFIFTDTDTIYMTSDGYYDQFGGENDEKFKRKNFEKLLLNISENPIDEQKEILLYKLLSWKKEIPQTDDITVVGIKLDK